MLRKIFLIILSLISVNTYAQTTGKVSQAEQKKLLINKEIVVLTKDLIQKGFITDGKQAENQTITGNDETGKVSISLVSWYYVNGKTKEIMEVCILQNNKSKEYIVWGENENTISRVSGGKIMTVNNNAATQKSASTCLQEFLKNGGTNCPACINCVNNCWSKPKHSKRLACAMGCASTCWPCIKSMWGFVKCIFG